MSIGEYIGIGATAAIAGGWIVVLIKEFLAPWIKRKLRSKQ